MYGLVLLVATRAESSVSDNTLVRFTVVPNFCRFNNFVNYMIHVESILNSKDGRRHGGPWHLGVS